MCYLKNIPNFHTFSFSLSDFITALWKFAKLKLNSYAASDIILQDLVQRGNRSAASSLSRYEKP